MFGAQVDDMHHRYRSCVPFLLSSARCEPGGHTHHPFLLRSIAGEANGAMRPSSYRFRFGPQGKVCMHSIIDQIGVFATTLVKEQLLSLVALPSQKCCMYRDAIPNDSHPSTSNSKIVVRW